MHQKCYMKTDRKSEMYTLGYTYFNCDVTLFRGFYLKQNFNNVPALWYLLLNAVLLAKEQSLPILNVLGLNSRHKRGRTYGLLDAKLEHYRGRGCLPILLGTDVPLRFSKHPHSYIQYFENHTHSYISVEIPDPMIYFITIMWPVYIYIYQFKHSISMYMYSFLPLWAHIGKYSILFYIVAACTKLNGEFQRYIYHPLT
jgi:hypothetical protein